MRLTLFDSQITELAIFLNIFLSSPLGSIKYVDLGVEPLAEFQSSGK